MKSLWNDRDAAQLKDELDLRVYSSRLLGQDTSLVLHGGGNTSVKITETNLLGQEEELLYVKGSGWDLETIERPGYAPVRMDHLIALSRLPSLSDPQMVNELKTHMTNASAPTPSVETILHAILPFKYVDHTHADAVVTITNTPKGLERIKEVYGDTVVIVPYVMPGFDLARLCAERFNADRNKNTIGMVLMNHGIFSFGETAKESYERMIDLVSRAEDWLDKNKAWQLTTTSPQVRETGYAIRLATLRQVISETAGFPMLVHSRADDRTLSFCRRDDVARISQQGPATPDHVIRTKQLPMLGNNIENYKTAYWKYFDKHAPNAKEPKSILDEAPRVVLDKEFGLCTVGRSMKEAMIVHDIYLHTMDIIERATELDSFQALPSQDIFDVEYWDLEQAKLKKSGTPPMFSGEVVMITGAASGIGKACVDSFLQRGAAVVGLDINPDIETLYTRQDFLGLVCDVSDESAIKDVIETAVQHFGGLDMLVLNAGIFPKSMRIDEMDLALWQKTLDINLTANLVLMRESEPYLKLAPNSGRVVIIGSKNVPAPGPGAGAYSASKAALNQLMRVAALEWGKDTIRINSLHPNAVFDTAIWSDEILSARAENYGMTVEQYKKRNVMKVEVTSHDVAELAAEMCGPLFAKTTAAQVPVDGGDERVI
ncbi:MAG: bifunctional aldolase/short-chain dehydrogenase [Gammaproteobacteria bacterium]|nr:bifunctional aldolase/short-chain dehydrogenase [Gammaproteobacteria bacterium]MDH5594448.1 bifunctional aldolase/short-chain dehydrogenase [Gammaproteobacteria bacterium]